jgi:hypothetical protein
MNLPINIKTNPDSDRHNNSEFPKVTFTSWYWRHCSWSAYQLPNGVKVMSKRQMGLLVGQPKCSVQNFVESNDLEAIAIQLPNGKLTQAYPLPVGAIYLQKLLNNGDLRSHRLLLNTSEWRQLIDALFHPSRGKAVTPNPCFFTGDYRVAAATSVQVMLENDINLEVLVLRSGEYRIEHCEGLKCIKSNSRWFSECSPVKAKIFDRLKLSKDAVECRVQREDAVKSIYALSLDDWLSVWEYFANKRNRRATAVLKACARESISARVAKSLSLY